MRAGEQMRESPVEAEDGKPEMVLCVCWWARSVFCRLTDAPDQVALAREPRLLTTMPCTTKVTETNSTHQILVSERASSQLSCSTCKCRFKAGPEPTKGFAIVRCRDPPSELLN